jgi:hypothetical protein
VLCLSLPASAEAKVPRVFFGAEADPVSAPMSSSDFARMRSAKLGTLRVAFNWAKVEPVQGGPRDWSFYDDLVTKAARARVSIMAVLVGSPAWAATDQAYAPTTAAGHAAFRGFVGAAVRRYGHGGRFWRTHRKLPRRPLSAYQVWNEPNYPPHWGDGPSNAAAYGAFLKETSGVIRRYDRKARIATGGLLANSTRGQPGYQYLSDLYKVPGVKKAFDAVAVHPYAENTRGVEGELSRIRAVMRNNGDSRTSVWISELGWATGGNNPYFSHTPAQQAALLTSTFRYVARHRKSFHVSRLVWFSWRDRTRADSQPLGWEYFCGLFDASNNPKPAWPAFRRFTRATR